MEKESVVMNEAFLWNVVYFLAGAATAMLFADTYLIVTWIKDMKKISRQQTLPTETSREGT